MDSNHTASYPRFAPNQVLTDTQLNGLTHFLDLQNRQTRTHGIGAGIVCGLKAAYVYAGECDEHYIVIASGYGFTSDGYLIQLPPSEMEQEDFSPCVEMPFEGRVYTHVRSYDWVNNQPWADREKYANWQSCDPLVLELLTADEGISYQASELDELAVSDRVLVLFLEKGMREEKPCVETDCTRNDQVVYHVRALLVHAECYNRLPGCDPLQRVHIPRFHTAAHLNTPGSNLQGLYAISSYQDIQTAYGEIVEGVRDELIDSVRAAYQQYEDFLCLGDEVDIREITERMESLIQQNRYDVDYHQYYYDFVLDLATAHREFIAAACKLTGGCWPVQGFPCHLGLTLFYQQANQMMQEEGGYRTPWYPSPVQNVERGEWEKARKLFFRMTGLIERFQFQFGTDNVAAFATADHRQNFPIRYTPSHRETYALGSRALPYQYDVSELSPNSDYLACWQPSDCCTPEPLMGYAFHNNELFPVEQSQPLSHSILDHTFYRIEGHVGKVCYTVDANGNPLYPLRDEMRSLKDRHNLEFDLVMLDLEANPSFFSELPHQLRGMEHMGGVPVGGTFIVVCAEVCVAVDPAGNKTFERIAVADFALHRSLACCLDDLNLSNEPPTLNDENFDTTTFPTFTETTSRGITPEPAPETSAKSVSQSGRRTAYYQELMSLNASGAFKGNSSYQSALTYVQAETSPTQSLETYQELSNRILNTYNRTKDPVKKQAYGQILERITHKVLDDLSAKRLAANAQEVLADQLGKLKKAKLSLNRISSNWKANELTKAPGRSALKKLLS